MPSTVFRKVILVLGTKSWLYTAQVVLILPYFVKMPTKITWKNPYLKFKKPSMFSLFTCKNNNHAKLASFILPCASFSIQVTDAKHTGLLTSVKSERKSELSRQVRLSNIALSKTVMTCLVSVSSEDFYQRFRYTA